jgi:hypothetical protein
MGNEVIRLPDVYLDVHWYLKKVNVTYSFFSLYKKYTNKYFEQTLLQKKFELLFEIQCSGQFDSQHTTEL